MQERVLVYLKDKNRGQYLGRDMNHLTNSIAELRQGWKVIGLSVPQKKIFDGFLPNMGMTAILVMCPRSFEQTFVPPSQ